MTHLNFGRNNEKLAAVTSWDLGEEGGKLRLGGGNLNLGGGGGTVASPAPPQMTPLGAAPREASSPPA